MKHNLLKKIFALSVLTVAMSGCGGSDDTTQSQAPTGPVSVSGDLNLVVDEDTGVLTFDLLQGVTNSGTGQIYTREFTYVKQTADTPPVKNFEGPDLPLASIYKQSNVVAVNSEKWKELLVHPFTATNNPEKFSKGTYKFTYILDNGHETQVTRNVTVVVNGVEDVVTDIAIINKDGFEVPKKFSVQFSAETVPANATYNTLTYTTSDPNIATVSSTGLITGVNFGNFTITATSKDGKVKKTVSGVVNVLKDPVAIETTFEGNPASRIEVAAETTAQLGMNLLPIDPEIDFGVRHITWTSSDPAKLSVDENGLVKPLKYDNQRFETLPEGSTETPANLNEVKVTATLTDDPDKTYTTTVIIKPSKNILFSANPTFDGPWDDKSLTLRSLDNSPSDQLNKAFPVEIVEDGNSIEGRSLSVNSTPGDLRIKFPVTAISQAGIKPGVDYELSYDMKLISGKFTSFFNPSSGGWFPFPGWGQKIVIGDSRLDANNTLRVKTTVPAAKFVAGQDFSFNLHTDPGGVFYLDNFKLEPK